MTVQLTLMRHGTAEPYTGSDASRALTPAGTAQVTGVARTLVDSGWCPGVIVHSPLVRARQTAALVAALLPPELPRLALEEVVAAGPELLELLAVLELPDPLIIGHNPGISELARVLLGSRGALPFRTASVAGFRLDHLPPVAPAELIFFAPSGLLSPAAGRSLSQAHRPRS